MEIVQKLDQFYNNLLVISQFPLARNYCTKQDFLKRQYKYDIIKGRVINFDNDFYNVSQNNKCYNQYLDDIRQLQIVDHMIFYENNIVFYQGFYFDVNQIDELIHIPNITYDLVQKLRSILQLRRLYPNTSVEVQVSLVNDLFRLINCYDNVLYVKWCPRYITGYTIIYNYQLQFNNQIEYGEVVLNIKTMEVKPDFKNLITHYVKRMHKTILITIRTSFYDLLLYHKCSSVLKNKLLLNCLGKDTTRDELLFHLIDYKHVVNTMVVNELDQIYLMEVPINTIIGDLLFIKNTVLMIYNIDMFFVDIKDRIIYAVFSNYYYYLKWQPIITNGFHNDFRDNRDRFDSIMLSTQQRCNRFTVPKIKGFIYRLDRYKLEKHVKRYIIQF